LFSILPAFARILARRFREESLAQVAGSLTFTTLLALVPLVTIALTVFSAFPVFDKVITALREFIAANFVPAAATKLITVTMPQFAEKAARLTALGVGMLAVSAVMLTLTIDRAFNRIWRVQRPRPLVQRLLVYWAVLTVGPLLLGTSLYVTSWAVTTALGFIREGRAEGLLTKVIALLLTCTAAAFVYRTVPNRKVEPADAAVGGILAGLAFEAMKSGFAAFTASVGGYRTVYGAFAGVPLFLLWLYLSWIVVLGGAVITATLPFLRAGGWKLARVHGSLLVEALQLLRALGQAHARGALCSTAGIGREIRVDGDEVERMLEQMRLLGWVARSGGGWVLARDLRSLTVADVAREFLYQADEVRREAREAGLEFVAAELGVAIDRAGRASLDEVFRPLAAESEAAGRRASR
jgi:membrane protein